MYTEFQLNRRSGRKWFKINFRKYKTMNYRIGNVLMISYDSAAKLGVVISGQCLAVSFSQGTLYSSDSLHTFMFYRRLFGNISHKNENGKLQ